MSKRFDLVAFDLDGTLIDNRVAIRENLNYALGLHGYDSLPDGRIDSMIGYSLLEMFERSLNEADRHLAPQMVEEYRKRYRDTSHMGVAILDGAVETLEALKEDGFMLALATSKVDYVVRPLLEKIGLHQYFDVVRGSEGEKQKPHPFVLEYIMHETGTSRDRTATVGDTVVDIETARNAGVYSIIVTTGVQMGMTTIREIESNRPDIIIDNLRKLSPHLYMK